RFSTGGGGDFATRSEAASERDQPNRGASESTSLHPAQRRLRSGNRPTVSGDALANVLPWVARNDRRRTDSTMARELCFPGHSNTCRASPNSPRLQRKRFPLGRHHFVGYFHFLFGFMAKNEGDRTDGWFH